jgi:aldehyde:ferredoxin oxidoreductase
MERLYNEMGSDVDPLSPENTLLFATGPLVGTLFPTASRLNVSAKSPLTGILGDSNVGGHFAPEMKYAGYDQVILKGKSKKLVYIAIEDSDIKLVDAAHLSGKDVYETDEIIRADLADRRVQTAIVGPAAENGVKFAGIFMNLMRPAGRTGMGTVMASKNVKALVVRGSHSVEVAHPRMFEKLVEEVEDEIYGHEQYWPRRLMGTTRILTMANVLGFLPTRHFLSGVFEHAEEVSGERLAEEYNVKTRGCFACNIPCSRFYVVKQGKFAGLFGEGPEYEALGSFTSRVGNHDLNTALKANDLCNKLGMDAISTGECIAWAMELYEKRPLGKQDTDGLDLSWGNGEAILALINKIARREGFGDILADGSKAAAEKLNRGHELTMQVKGLDIIMADPRGLKGFGLGFAVASRGADHLRSEPFVELYDDPKRGEIMFGIPEATLRLANRGKGKLISYFEDWCATRIVNLERAFNVREGMTRSDDTLPRRFRESPLSEGLSSGTVVKLDPMLDEYYSERGWNLKTGIPTRKTLENLSLEYVADDLCKQTETLSKFKG